MMSLTTVLQVSRKDLYISDLMSEPLGCGCGVGFDFLGGIGASPLGVPDWWSGGAVATLARGPVSRLGGVVWGLKRLKRLKNMKRLDLKMLILKSLRRRTLKVIRTISGL